MTKGSFTRDEWCTPLRLVNIMNPSMFSRCQFRPVEKATTVSKRIQERKMEEQLAVAKPNRGQSSSFGPDVSNILENPQLDSECVLRSTSKLTRNKDQTVATCSQERNEDIPGQGSCGKL